MIKVIFANAEIWKKQSKLEDLLAKLPPKIQQRALKYSFEKDAYNFVLGRLLLKNALVDIGLPFEKLASITYNAFDKPLIDDLEFSIAHSENHIICAYSKTHTLGVDVEVYRPIVIEHLRSSFNQGEWQTINQAKDKLLQLYWYWTRKEAVLKALGKGMRTLRNIHIHNLDKASYFNDVWYLQELNIGKEVIAALCYENKEVEVKLASFEKEGELDFT